MLKNILGKRNVKIKSKAIKKCTNIVLTACIASVLISSQCFFANINNISNISVTVYADEVTDSTKDYINVGSYEDLLELKNNPSAKYILVNDIDMTGKEWIPFDFSGELNGNGHSILNLTVENTAPQTRITYDGNMKTYDTYFGAMFGAIENAVIKNLSIVNERVKILTENNCFVAGIAGYSDKSVISNCNISGTYELTTGSHMLGVAGVVGFGNGTVENTDIDVTLVCTDTNVEDKDEQFMGGVIADGYMTISNCNVNIKGYDSDHGYVHNGGIIGMNMPYPKGSKESGNIKNCTVNGFITFFEDNKDRRAYCSAIYGEMLGGLYVSNNKENFKRDERFDYSINLSPEQCENPQYTAVVTEGDCNNYGFTTYTCSQCGYSYTDNYTVKQHDVEQFTTIKVADYQNTGLKQGVCSICGQTVTESVDKLIKARQCTISAQNLELNKNQNVQLSVAVTPQNANLSNAKWQSSDESVVTVDENGIISAIKKGKAIISYVIDNNTMAQCNITVKQNSTATLLIILFVLVGVIAVITGVVYVTEQQNKKKKRKK